MQININEHRALEIKEIYEPIFLVAGNKDCIVVCERDDGFEIRIPRQAMTYRVDLKTGVIRELVV